MKRPVQLAAWGNPARSTYLVVGIIATLVMLLALGERTIGFFGIVPTIVGIAGMVFGWINAPIFVLLSIAVALLISQPMLFPSTYLVEMLLATSVLVYMIAHYRLCSLTWAVFPTDPRKPLTRQLESPRPPIPALLEFFMALTVIPYLLYLALRKTGPKRRHNEPERRAQTTVPPDEIVWALILAIVCAGAALAIYLSTYWRPAPLNAFPRQWQLGLILWSVVLPVLLIYAIMSYVRWHSATPMEARLLLADELWKQTRGEQRRIARWTVWARKRQDRKATS